MSFYIKVAKAELLNQPKGQVTVSQPQIAVRILTRDNIIKTDYLSPSKSPEWNSSFVGSTKQKKIDFQIIQKANDQEFHELSKCSYDIADLTINPQKEIHQIITTNTGDKLYLDLYQSTKKNFIGPIEFYDQNYLEESRNIPIIQKVYITKTHNYPEQQVKIVQTLHSGKQDTVAKKSPIPKSFFVCCQGSYDDQGYTIQKGQNSEIKRTDYERHYESYGSYTINKTVEYKQNGK